MTWSTPRPALFAARSCPIGSERYVINSSAPSSQARKLCVVESVHPRAPTSLRMQRKEATPPYLNPSRFPGFKERLHARAPAVSQQSSGFASSWL